MEASQQPEEALMRVEDEAAVEAPAPEVATVQEAAAAGGAGVENEPAWGEQEDEEVRCTMMML